MAKAYYATIWIMLILVVTSEEKRICTQRYSVPHRGITHETHIDVRVWKLCSVNQRLPAAFISTGSLVMKDEYDGLASALAMRHFVVFVADYSTRVPEIPAFRSIVSQASEEARGRWKCYKNGNHMAVSMFRTLARFANRLADASKSLVLGHSSGSTVVTYDLFRRCDENRNDLMVRHFCDGARDDDIRYYRPAVVALFDGLVPLLNMNEMRDRNTLVLNMVSKFASEKFSGNATELLPSRAIDLKFDVNVNHFGPNDFIEPFNHVKTKCAALTGKGSEFQTSLIIQTQVVMAIAQIVTDTYYKFVSSGDVGIPVIAEALKETRYVEHVEFKI